jgi:hypothetical protein
MIRGEKGKSKVLSLKTGFFAKNTSETEKAGKTADPFQEKNNKPITSL